MGRLLAFSTLAMPPRKTTKKPASTRRTPKQTRAKALVDAIVTATAHILREAGPDAATTNHIAERAGVSIGSLYQYFPNKTALYTAVAQRHLERLEAELEVQFERMATVQPDAMVPTLIEALFAIAQVDAPLDAALYGVSLWGLTGGLTLRFQLRVEQLLAQLLVDRAEDFPAPIDDPQTTARVITRAVSGVFDATLIADPEALADPVLIEETVRLVSMRFGL